MLFSKVIGQQSVKQHLMEIARSGQIPHSQLFLAQPGAGGLPLALAFSQYIVCGNKGETDSCGTCNACMKAQKLIHPDIHYSFPVVNKNPSHKSPQTSIDYLKEFREVALNQPYIDELEWLQYIGAENKQGNITADEARNILKGLSLTTFEADYKIQIIWMAEALAKEGNILLKLLEEPPAKTVLILIAENQEAILPTILSRCQLVKINKIDDVSVAEALLRKGIPRENATHIAYLADGNYKEAVKLTEASSSIDTIRLTHFFRYTIRIRESTNAGSLLKWTEEMSKIGRENLKSFLEYLLHIVRETVQAKYVSSSAAKLTEEEVVISKALDKYISLHKLSKLVELINQKHYEIERNVSPKFVLMDMSLKMNQILWTKD
ncbi:MAG: hypothetical protein IPM95_02550 [Sphingobacteriales bacterium]|nr:hypothetical protein [Sphingobacteriales bacterium]